MRRSVFRVLLGIAALWALAMFVIFVVAHVSPWLPSNVELPWSEMSDFVAMPDGTLVVYSAFFERLLVYGPDGVFVRSQPGVRARGGHFLAADTRGRLFLSLPPVLCIADLESAEVAAPTCHRAPPAAQGWRVDERGAQPIVGSRPTPPPDRPVETGETLFTFVDQGPVPRQHYRFEGGIVVRRGSCLLVGETGPARRVCSPWHLAWARFPLPGALAWPLLLLLAIAGRRLKQRDVLAPERRPGTSARL